MNRNAEAHAETVRILREDEITPIRYAIVRGPAGIFYYDTRDADTFAAYSDKYGLILIREGRVILALHDEDYYTAVLETTTDRSLCLYGSAE